MVGYMGDGLQTFGGSLVLAEGLYRLQGNGTVVGGYLTPFTCQVGVVALVGD